MTVNLDIPVINKRLRLELPRFRQTADQVGKAIERTSDDAASRLGNVSLPSVDLGGALEGAKRTIDQTVRTLSDGGQAVASGAERAATGASVRVRHLGQDVDSTIQDLRSLRITRDSGRDPWPGVALIMGVVGGVVARQAGQVGPRRQPRGTRQGGRPAQPQPGRHPRGQVGNRRCPGQRAAGR
jgi:hypothetical protein